MTNERSYRLGDYRITIYDDVLARWEHHVPLGMVRSGRCFTYGDVLIIGERSHDEDGYLIGEFLDELQKLILWTGTRYFCYAGELLDAVTGHGLTDEVLARYSSFADRNDSVTVSASNLSPGTYRLGSYRLIVTVEGQISWQAHEGLHGIAGGPCRIESGILVIGTREYNKPGADKKEFFDALDTLHRWDKTKVWCRGPFLRPCRDPQQAETSKRTGTLHDMLWNPAANDKPVPGGILVPALTSRVRETSLRLAFPGMHVVTGAWKRVRAVMDLSKWPLMIITVVLLFGSVAAAMYIAEKGLSWPHGFKKHHYDHHHEH